MSASLQAAASLLEKFKSCTNSEPLDTQKCEAMLSELKVLIIQFQPVLQGNLEDTTARNGALLARETLETAVLFSIKSGEDLAAERNFLQLKSYYMDMRGKIPDSDKEALITGLNLLRLLVQNRIAEFHVELELLPDHISEAAFVKLPIELEQCLMEGAYTKVLGYTENAPDDHFRFFMDRLKDTVREEIISCSEVAYKDLSISDAKQLFMASLDSEIEEIVSEREWQVVDNRIQFSQSTTKSTSIPSDELVKKTLGYAKELERIV